MSSMSDRKAELERKKAKLQALREEKDRRRREKEQKDAEEALQRAANSASVDKRQELDEMLSSLGVAPVKDVLSSFSSLTSLTPPQTASPDTSLPHSDRASLPHQGLTKKPPSLQVVSVQSTDIPPKEIVTYPKQTQTTSTGVTEMRDGRSSNPSPLSGYMEDWWRPRKAHATDYYDEYNLNPGLEWEDEFTVLTFDDGNARQGDEEDAAFHGKLPPGILPHGLPTVKEVQPAVTQPPQEKKNEEEKEKKARELSADEKQTIMLSAEFQRFISRAGRVIERALAESVDIYTDYTGAGDTENALDDKSDAKMSLVRQFYDPRWSRGRCVTSVDWSAAHPELLLAAYHDSDDAPHDPTGVVLLWNTKFKKTTPEDIFHCQSPVMSACFAKFHPNLILGGTYSGQIVLWDNRVQKRTPVQRTPLSSLAHTHPVYCLSVVGSPNAHNLVSISSDGRLCSWSLDMLGSPQETLELQYRQTKPVAVTSAAFPMGDVNNFLLGAEDGNVYTGSRHGQRAGVAECVESHAGPVTSVSCHAAPGPGDASQLYLTSSVDWTVKLWSSKESKPLYSFEESSDYVSEASWSPVHPALFAAADAAGRLALWHLNKDTEVPVCCVSPGGGGAGMNRCSWSQSGQLLTAGADDGRIWVYELNEHLSQPRHDEWTKLLYTLQELRNNQADEETDKLSLSASGPASLTSLTSMASNPLR